MAKFNLTEDEVDVILELIESRLDELSGGLEEVYKEDIDIMSSLQAKLSEDK